MQRFDGRVAVVTGGASGIGQATAVRLAAEGATVVAVDVDAAGLDDHVGTGVEGGAPGAASKSRRRVGDVTDRDFAPSIVDEIVDRHGRLDVLANVAGILRTGITHERVSRRLGPGAVGQSHRNVPLNSE